MTRTAKVNLTRDGRGTIEVNGQALHGVRGLTVTSEAGGVPHLTLDFVIYELELDGELVVTVPPKTAASLVALGWTPPEGQEVTDDANAA